MNDDLLLSDRHRSIRTSGWGGLWPWEGQITPVIVFPGRQI
jgi:hypothetical protein